MKEEYKCPCQEVDPDNFLTNENVIHLLETKDTYKFKQIDYYKVYNCVHCGACGTQDERFLLKQKFLKDGNKIEGLKETVKALKDYGTPFFKNKNRIKLPEGIAKKSNTLLYFGCFTAVKTPKYGQDVARYLVNKGIDFTVLQKEECCGYPILCTGEINTYDLLVERNRKLFLEKGFDKIITVCPSCFMVFKKHYNDLGIKIDYFTEYLTPSNKKKLGNLIIQHACPLVFIEFPDIEKNLIKIFEKNGYNILKIPHSCCGGGVGHQLRVDVADKIASRRMRDFKVGGEFVSEIKEGQNSITTYCPDAYWILKVFGRKFKLKFTLREICDLLT